MNGHIEMGKMGGYVPSSPWASLPGQVSGFADLTLPSPSRLANIQRMEEQWERILYDGERRTGYSVCQYMKRVSSERRGLLVCAKGSGISWR